MKYNYETLFHNEIERILKKLYYEPLNPHGNDKRVHIETERKYVLYLIEHNLVRDMNLGGKGYSLILERRGYEVFEKYGDWKNYRKKVIDMKTKVEESKNLAQRFWWIPIVISILALGVSILALIKK
jgi:transposase